MVDAGWLSTDDVPLVDESELAIGLGPVGEAATPLGAGRVYTTEDRSVAILSQFVRSLPCGNTAYLLETSHYYHSPYGDPKPPITELVIAFD